MSDFWALSDDSSAADTGKEFDGGGGNFDPIPDGSNVLAVIDEAKWADKDGNEFISLRWSVMQPEDYANRKVFQKLWVTDLDPTAKDREKGIKKRDKARKMLAAIDANAGGKLTSKPEKPTDDSMSLHLCNKPMVITCRLWEVEDRSTGGTISGNWISAVAPKSKGVDVKAATAPKAKASSGYGAGGRPRNDLDGDEIPFAPSFL